MSSTGYVIAQPYTARHCDPYMARVVPNNPIAFPPSMEVSVGYYCCMDATGRVESGTETESNAGAVTELFFGVALILPGAKLNAQRAA